MGFRSYFPRSRSQKFLLHRLRVNHAFFGILLLGILGCRVPRMAPNVEDCGPSRGLYLCQIVLRYRCARTELITPDLTCPSTYQLLRSSGGDSGPDLSFDKSASPERLFSLTRVSLAKASKPDLSFG
ncbi:hypothetical protein Tco_0907760 [Tanacetum coccineum]|uniref:Uncharacterized protein n=1 Tax=Tanacetum coccineum TaxID=301880 RepID=A0ABQ5CKE8_9ASTR